MYRESLEILQSVTEDDPTKDDPSVYVLEALIVNKLAQLPEETNRMGEAEG